MKKNVFKVGSVIVFVLALGFTTYTSQNQKVTLSDLVMENVEALANPGEVDATCTFSIVEKNQDKNRLKCEGSGTLCCVMN